MQRDSSEVLIHSRRRRESITHPALERSEFCPHDAKTCEGLQNHFLDRARGRASQSEVEGSVALNCDIMAPKKDVVVPMVKPSLNLK